MPVDGSVMAWALLVVALAVAAALIGRLTARFFLRATTVRGGRR